MDINEITFAINGAVFEVNKVLGPGFLGMAINGWAGRPTI